MTADLAGEIERVLGRRPLRIAAMGGGCIAPVYRCDLTGGERIVAKQPSPGRTLDCEAWMLRYLKRHSSLPVPAVIAAEPDLLLIEYIDSGDSIEERAQGHLAELLAALHAIRGPHFGFERDTVIGPLDQPNPATGTWLEFFRDQRLLHRARAAQDAGRLPARLLARIEDLAAQLSRRIEEPRHPALIHGDCWSGNVLAKAGRIAGLIDPAIYWAHPEIELAFGTLFGPFGDAFFRRYSELAPIAAGFFEERRDLYNLYPLLVHVQLFGGSYVQSVARTLDRLRV